MRVTAINKYPGKCALCGQPVAPHEGLLVRVSGKMVPAHKNCKPVRCVPDPIDTSRGWALK